MREMLGLSGGRLILQQDGRRDAALPGEGHGACVYGLVSQHCQIDLQWVIGLLLNQLHNGGDVKVVNIQDLHHVPGLVSLGLCLCLRLCQDQGEASSVGLVLLSPLLPSLETPAISCSCFSRLSAKVLMSCWLMSLSSSWGRLGIPL